MEMGNLLLYVGRVNHFVLVIIRQRRCRRLILLSWKVVALLLLLVVLVVVEILLDGLEVGSAVGDPARLTPVFQNFLH